MDHDNEEKHRGHLFSVPSSTSYRPDSPWPQPWSREQSSLAYRWCSKMRPQNHSDRSLLLIAGVLPNWRPGALNCRADGVCSSNFTRQWTTIAKFRIILVQLQVTRALVLVPNRKVWSWISDEPRNISLVHSTMLSRGWVQHHDALVLAGDWKKKRLYELWSRARNYRNVLGLRLPNHRPIGAF